MHELGLSGVLAIFAAGVVFGVIVDRFILWPLAVLIARLDGRFRIR